MDKLPQDIVNRIHSDFHKNEQGFVLGKLQKMYGSSSNFSGLGVIRSVLFLANGDLDKFNVWANSDDYRDILLYAEMYSGNYGHYFRMSFDEIKHLKKTVGKELMEQFEEEQSLPFDFFEEKAS